MISIEPKKVIAIRTRCRKKDECQILKKLDFSIGQKIKEGS